MIPGLGPIPVTRPLPMVSCLRWVTDQPDWLRKVVIGGLWTFGSLSVVALPFFVGYCGRVVRAGFGQSSIPAWDKLGDLYRDGLSIGAMWLVHWGPLGLAVWGASRSGAFAVGDPHDNPGWFFLLAGAGALIVLGWALYVNTVLLRFIVLRQVRAAAQIGETAAFVRRNLANFGRLFVLLLPANWIGQASCCLCGVGLFPGSFWVACTYNYALGQIGRCDIYLPREWQERRSTTGVWTPPSS